ncbi:hypothetical protein ATANTOWER_026988 [Ataeniobius toweri]|uniref:Uncharacterized protein n=1 Tax=Ataeniobius toweri TaxID=208326 RepID=A0ABU7BKX8_9TELE|nr:hypothetical protein [Ataeniobius toweri]
MRRIKLHSIFKSLRANILCVLIYFNSLRAPLSDLEIKVASFQDDLSIQTANERKPNKSEIAFNVLEQSCIALTHHESIEQKTSQSIDLFSRMLLGHIGADLQKICVHFCTRKPVCVSKADLQTRW